GRPSPSLPDQSSSNRGALNQLCNGQQILPERRLPNCLFRNDEGVPGFNSRGQYTAAAPPTLFLTCDHRSVSTDNEDGLLFCQAGNSSGLLQVPSSILSGNVGNVIGVVHLARNEEQFRSLAVTQSLPVP